MTLPLKEWLSRRVRADLQSMQPYRSARSLSSGSEASVWLDANENPLPAFCEAAQSVFLNRYPQPQPAALRRRLADYYNVRPEQIFLGRGSDEGIDLLIRLLCEAGKDSIMICPPTFGMYETYARVQNAEVIKAPLDTATWQLDLEKIKQSVTAQTKLIFIPSPNAPLGHVMAREDILQLCKNVEEQALVVIDEAYVEFSEMPGLTESLADRPNLVVLRTLSKAHALAGERIGCVIGNETLIAWLQKIAAPYPLAQTSIYNAMQALGANGLAHMRETKRMLLAEKARMRHALLKSVQVRSIFPSEANFILLQTADSAAFLDILKRHGIRARDRSGDIANCVRLTIGTPDENNAVLKALDLYQDKETVPSDRFHSLRRQTKETDIEVTINLDTPSQNSISTGIGFFDHMLEQVAKHGRLGLTLRCRGDLHIDAHHTVEDCALALGAAVLKALGDKKGIARFAFTAPLDEAVAQVVLDLSGRAHAQFEGTFPTPMIGTLPSEMVPHFFISFASALQAALHVSVKGDNAHHMAEACFKALGCALRQAVTRSGADMPSTKGVL